MSVPAAERTVSRLVFSGCIAAVFVVGQAESAERTQAAVRPAGELGKVPGLICAWDFQEPGGTPRRGRGPHAYALEERNGPIERVEAGVWGPYSARIKVGQWFRIQRDSCPALDLHGPGAQYTILAWIQRMTDNRWQYIAGMWDEKDAGRQYALFISGSLKTSWRTLKREPADHQAHAYASAEGGGTAPSRICLTYSTGATRLEKNRWYFLAATYDQEQLKTYVDGELDLLEDYNPYRYPAKAIFDGGAAGADFTVGQRAVPSWPTYPEGAYRGVSEKAGPLGFEGLIGGLAVYNRALTAPEIRAVHQRAKAAGASRNTR